MSAVWQTSCGRPVRLTGSRCGARRGNLGVDASYLSRVESGERSPSLGLRERAESLYGLDSDRLALSAGQVPADVLGILQRQPELLNEIRAKHGRTG